MTCAIEGIPESRLLRGQERRGGGGQRAADWESGRIVFRIEGAIAEL